MRVDIDFEQRTLSLEGISRIANTPRRLRRTGSGSDGEVIKVFATLRPGTGGLADTGDDGLVLSLDGVLEDALRYVREREAFGRKIGEFQALQHYIANVAMWQEQADLIVI